MSCSTGGGHNSAAHAVEDITHSRGTYTSQQIQLAMNAISQAQRMQGLDLTTLQTQVSQMSQQVKNASPEELVNIAVKNGFDLTDYEDYSLRR